MLQKKPSDEYLDFLRKYKEYEQNFLFENNLYHKYDNIQDFLKDKVEEYIEYHIEAGFTPQEIEESFKGMSLISKNNLNL
jgi:hypothetical protein